MIKKNNLNIKIFADGASLEQVTKLNELDYISGFTTNPSLIRQAGINDYEEFALSLLSIVKDKSVSFEVFADDIVSMKKQALKIASWGKNVAVKIPITNTQQESTADLIVELANNNIMCNVTAIFTTEQIEPILKKINVNSPIIYSIFAGRIADTGLDPEITIKNAVTMIDNFKKAEILWASSRELYNIIQAINCNCQIITVGHDLLNKIDLFGKDLDIFSLETVKMFYSDATAANFNINTEK